MVKGVSGGFGFSLSPIPKLSVIPWSVRGAHGCYLAVRRGARIWVCLTDKIYHIYVTWVILYVGVILKRPAIMVVITFVRISFLAHGSLAALEMVNISSCISRIWASAANRSDVREIWSPRKRYGRCYKTTFCRIEGPPPITPRSFRAIDGRQRQTSALK